jgi:hypothetical protein
MYNLNFALVTLKIKKTDKTLQFFSKIFRFQFLNMRFSDYVLD